jgi:SEC-C motif-containing protein
MPVCPCGSGNDYQACCGPILSGAVAATSAEQLMRARYSAFVNHEIDFLTASLHPDHRHDHDAAATRRWAEKSEWLGLQIVDLEAGGPGDEAGVVEFIATFKDKDLVRRHHERSEFKKQDGSWFFVDGKVVPPKTQVKQTPKVGRNDPCPCGSGKKYKKCCGS